MPTDGPIWTLDGVTPTVAASAWVAPTASVIGDVHLGEDVGIWFHCVLRGDYEPIRVGDRTNIQDGTIVHITAGKFPCLIGADVTIGHACIIHACTLHDRAFVGMGATVLDGAVIETDGMLAAGGLLTPGKRIGAGELWAGSPARLMRVMSAEERAGWNQNAVRYVEAARLFKAGLLPVR